MIYKLNRNLMLLLRITSKILISMRKI